MERLHLRRGLRPERDVGAVARAGGLPVVGPHSDEHDAVAAVAHAPVVFVAVFRHVLVAFGEAGGNLMCNDGVGDHKLSRNAKWLDERGGEGEEKS